MNKGMYTVVSNELLVPGVHKLVLSGDTSCILRPGQFVDIRLEGCFLRRPFSIAGWDGETLMVIYKTVGHGTEQMTALPAGTKLDCLVGLGNGFDLTPVGEHPLLLGGGAGVTPLYPLAKELTASGRKVTAVLGFNTKSEIFYEDEFRALGCETMIRTMDGSYGTKGLVTDAMPAHDYFFACGPIPMLKAVYHRTETDGQFSLEARMGCGFGACMGCSIETKHGPRRVCKDGPVFRKEELLWQTQE